MKTRIPVLMEERVTRDGAPEEFLRRLKAGYSVNWEDPVEVALAKKETREYYPVFPSDTSETPMLTRREKALMKVLRRLARNVTEDPRAYSREARRLIRSNKLLEYAILRTLSQSETVGLGKDLRKGTMRQALETVREHKIPDPVLRVWIPKKEPGELRPLGVPTQTDRVLQTAIRFVIEPWAHSQLRENCIGFRYRYGRPITLARFQGECERWARGRYKILDTDIKQFFPSVPHSELRRWIRKLSLKDEDRRYLKATLRAPVVEPGKGTHRPQSGVPQGGVMSPTLCNLALVEFDKGLELQGRPWARYADNLLVGYPLEDNRPTEEKLLELEDQLPRGLEFHRGKTQETGEWLRTLGADIYPSEGHQDCIHRYDPKEEVVPMPSDGKFIRGIEQAIRLAYPRPKPGPEYACRDRYIRRVDGYMVTHTSYRYEIPNISSSYCWSSGTSYWTRTFKVPDSNAVSDIRLKLGWPHLHRNHCGTL